MTQSNTPVRLPPPPLPEPGEFAVPGFLSDAEREARKQRYATYVHGALAYLGQEHAAADGGADDPSPEHEAIHTWLLAEADSAVGEHMVRQQLVQLLQAGALSEPVGHALARSLRINLDHLPLMPATDPSTAATASNADAQSTPLAGPTLTLTNAAPDAADLGALARELRDLSCMLAGQVLPATVPAPPPMSDIDTGRPAAAAAPQPETDVTTQTRADLHYSLTLLRSIIAAKATLNAGTEQALKLGALATALSALHPEQAVFAQLALAPADDIAPDAADQV